MNFVQSNLFEKQGSLRATQWKLAIGEKKRTTSKVTEDSEGNKVTVIVQDYGLPPNASMLQFLGKQKLGQRDEVHVENTLDINVIRERKAASEKRAESVKAEPLLSGKKR